MIQDFERFCGAIIVAAIGIVIIYAAVDGWSVIIDALRGVP